MSENVLYSSPAHSTSSSVSTSFMENELMELEQEGKEGSSGFQSKAFVKKLYHMITTQDPEILSFTPGEHDVLKHSASPGLIHFVSKALMYNTYISK